MWYAMPLAQPIQDGLPDDGDAVGTVEAFIPLARTLADLHGHGIHHRDIKPANILFFDGRLCFTDFCLVRYPGREDVTPDKHQLGPRFTMAPEMRRDPKAADGAAADVYSFAKTLWIALTGQPLAFDGQYSAASGLSVKQHHPEIFSMPLDDLLRQCTDDDPAVRPGSEEVARRLEDWTAMMGDYRARNPMEWLSVQGRLFPMGAPERATWTGIDEICSVLRLLADSRNLNHMLFPSGGGMDLNGAAHAVAEAGSIELDVGWTVIVKPRSLSFESFGPGSTWNYFRLEADLVTPTGTPGAWLGSDDFDEELCELAPGQYVTAGVLMKDSYLGQPLPNTARRVVRALKGAFLIVAKRSWYNHWPETYDGRHARIDGDKFRQLISMQVARFPGTPP